MSLLNVLLTIFFFPIAAPYWIIVIFFKLLKKVFGSNK